MTVEGAVIREQGQTFAIVIVQSHVIHNPSEAREAQMAVADLFPGMPIVLMAQDGRGIPTYYGRRDIVDFLSHISMNRIPWKRYSFG